MRLVYYSSRFKKSLKKVLGSGKFNKQEIQDVIKILASREKLHESYKDHALSGDLIGHRECHIRPNLLLVYRIENKDLVLLLVDIGNHSNVL